MTDRGSLVSLEKVSKTYRRGSEDTIVLDGVDLRIGAGEFVSLMGPSGSGKTTLLNIVGGVDRPSSGVVWMDGVRIDALGEGALTDWRSRNVGYIFQFYHLIGVLSARRNVELPLMLTGLGARERKRRANGALELVGLADRAGHKPAELSGGQQQRVAIARALVADPAVLVCDEPTGDLDRDTATEVMELLGLLNADHDKTIIMVTHDPEAAAYAGRQLLLRRGQVVENAVATDGGR